MGQMATGGVHLGNQVSESHATGLLAKGRGNGQVGDGTPALDYKSNCFVQTPVDLGPGGWLQR